MSIEIFVGILHEKSMTNDTILFETGIFNLICLGCAIIVIIHPVLDDCSHPRNG